MHGPVPRSYDYSLPRKMVLGALRSALSAKVAQQKLTVVDGWALESHKTKAFRQSLDKLDGDTQTILLVSSTADVNLERASRNLDGVTLVPTMHLEPYDLLRHDRLMLSREAAEKLSRALSAVKREAEPVVQIEAAPAVKAEPKQSGKAKAVEMKGKSRKRQEARASKSGKERKAEGQAQGEKGIGHGDEALSGYPAADHHRKGPGCERDTAHGGVRGCSGRYEDGSKRSGTADFQGEG